MKQSDRIRKTARRLAKNLVALSNRPPEGAVQARNAAGNYSCCGLALHPFGSADATAQSGNVMSEVSQRANHPADMDGASRLRGQIDTRIKTQVQNLHRTPSS